MNENGTIQPGELLGNRYLIEALIGEGAFARTYRARDSRLERVVAIKVLRPHIAADPAFLSRFRQESRAVARIDDQNVVHVYDSGEERGASYLVMQYVPGQDLKQFILEQAPVAPAEAIRITREILHGLAAVHRAGIIHRDIKPQNVLFGHDQIARLTDFGIAYDGDRSGQPFGTEHGTTLGTPAYMAPEQAKGETVTEATDLYAVGIILFELLTGRMPFSADSQLAMMVAHVEQPPPAPSTFQRGVPADLDVITLRAMAKLPAQRFASATDMERSLANALRNLPGSGQGRQSGPAPIAGPSEHSATTVFTPRATVQPAQPEPRPRPRSAGRWVLPVLFLLLAAGVLAGTLTDLFDDLGGGNDNSTTRPTQTPRSTSGGLKPVTPDPEVTPTEPDNGEVIESDPTTATEEGGAPTIAPSDGNYGDEITAESGGALEPLSRAFSAVDWQGGVTRDDSGFLGRPWTAIYGEASGSNTASLSFTLENAPEGDATLIVSGVDDESGGDSPISISVNGVEVFAGSSPFANWDGVSEEGPWTDVSITIPAGTLQGGSNQIVFANLSPDGTQGAPPYVLLGDALLTE